MNCFTFHPVRERSERIGRCERAEREQASGGSEVERLEKITRSYNRKDNGGVNNRSKALAQH